MAVDLAQFHQVFFEESFEGLDAMEGGLLNLSAGAAGNDAINTIFRAAHSIKGGSATFGFADVAGFTHVMETLLDEMRESRITPTLDAVDIMLQSVDGLREMLAAVQSGSQVNQARIVSLRGQLERILQTSPASEARDADAATSAEVAATSVQGWNIAFRPHPHLLKSGNEPVRMFRELATLGDLNVTADLSMLPSLADMNAESCVLGWKIQLTGNIAVESIRDVFDWVMDDCDLNISPLARAAHDGTPVQPEVADGWSAPASGNKAMQTAQYERPASMAIDGASIRVNIDKVDALVNMVGELVITQSMLSQIGDAEQFDHNFVRRLRDGLAQLERNTREMQESVMRIRMLPISFTFNRFPRMAHDLSQKLGKRVEIRMSGEQTEVDKTVMEKIGDPLVHLVRNSLDHGIETPAVRRAAGKPEAGTLRLNAYHKDGNMVIEICDDGAGLNKEKILNKAVERGLVKAAEPLPDDRIYELIFMPGFSTADVVSDISGRGVGLDVVRRNIYSAGGKIEVESELGIGTTVRIRLPLTLAILDGMSVAVGRELFIIPLAFIVESLQPAASDIRAIAGGQWQVVPMRGEYLPLLALHKLFGIETQVIEPEEGILVLIEAEGRKVALLVDMLVGQHQVVLKSLESNYRKVEGIAGATIMGDGRVALILDAAALVRMGMQ